MSNEMPAGDLENIPLLFGAMRMVANKELLEQVGSRTHFTNEMLRHSKWKDPRVFMVTG